MANLTGTAQAFHSDTSVVDSTQFGELGRRAWDTSGNEYVYLQGTASTVAGDWVVYDQNYGTTRLAANEVGPVAVAMAAITADRFGWYQTFGVNEIARTDSVAAGAALYIDGTTGRADDLGVTGDLIIGAYSLTADTSNVATVSLNYPSVSNDLGQSGTATPGGPEGAVQYNASSVFTGSAGLVFNQVVGSARLTGPMEVEAIRIEDSNASHYLNIRTTSNLTADRNFTLVPGDAARTVTMAGDLNIAADLITSGANSLTFTTTGSTNVTLPTSGTLYGTATDSITSANLATSLTNETGTGTVVFNTSPGFITAANPSSNDGATLGTSSLGWSDLFLAPGAVIDFGAGDLTFTHSTNSMIVAGGTFQTATLTNTGVTTLNTSLNTVLAATSGVVGTATGTLIRTVVGSASTTAEGVVELATAAEITTGTDATRAVTPDGFAGSDYGKRLVQLKVSADDTAITTGSNKMIWFVPVELNGMNLVDIEGFLTGTSTTVQTIVVRKRDGTASSVNMLSTQITIDASEWSSLTAATAPVIDTANDDVATGNMIAIDFAGASGTAKGVGVHLSFQTP